MERNLDENVVTAVFTKRHFGFFENPTIRFLNNQT